MFDIYGKLVPIIVKGVPPPVPPRNGLTEVNVGVRLSKYLNSLWATNPFSFISSWQVVSLSLMLLDGT